VAVAFAELASSPRIEKDSRERVFVATGSTDENEVESEAYADLPATDGGLGNLVVDVAPIDSGQGMWEVTARYRRNTPASPPVVGESDFEFEIGTTSTHITQSKATVGGYAPPGTPAMPDFDEAIGVTQDGVDGCDILTPESRFSETHYLSTAMVTAAYRRMLRSMVGKVNNAAFRDHAAGEVLLIGVRGGKRASDTVWQLTFTFATSDNTTALSVGSITGIAKEGFEYLWVYYEPAVSADRIVPVPAFAYVERVYDSASFSALGIGT